MTPFLALFVLLPTIAGAGVGGHGRGDQDPVPATPPVATETATEAAIKRLQEENEKLRQDQVRLATDILVANRNIAEATKAFEEGSNASAKAAALETLKTEVARKLRLMNVKEAKRLLAEINARNSLAIDGFDRGGRAMGVLDLCASKVKEKAFASRYAALSNLFDVDPSARATIERAAKATGSKSPETMSMIRALASGSWGSVLPMVTNLFAIGKKSGWTAETEFVTISARLTDALGETNRSYKAQVDRLEAETLLTREELGESFERASAAYAGRSVAIRDFASKIDERRFLEGKVAERYAKDQADLNGLVANAESGVDAFGVTLADEGASRPRLAEIDQACSATAISANALFGIETGMVGALKSVQRDLEERLAGSRFANDRDFSSKAIVLRAKLQGLVESAEALASETKTTVVGPARGLSASK